MLLALGDHDEAAAVDAQRLAVPAVELNRAEAGILKPALEVGCRRRCEREAKAAHAAVAHDDPLGLGAASEGIEAGALDQEVVVALPDADERTPRRHSTYEVVP